MPFWKRIKKCKRGEAPLAFSCLRFLFQAHLRRYSPYPFGSVGKGLERETLCPFPRLRRFGTHYETGSKFLLLFSIKSKEEILCFAERVPNGRSTDVVQEKTLRDCAQSALAPNKNDLSISLKSFSHKGGYIKIRRTDGRY